MRMIAVVALFMLAVCAFAQTATSGNTCIKKPGDTIARLNWTAPTHYQNNEPLSVDNISHYTVAHIPPKGPELVYIVESGTSLEVPLFDKGRHRFTVKTHTYDGQESVSSASVCKEI